jgi:hypothetical protein
MTKTEKMVREINGFFKQIGEEEISMPISGEGKSELELLRNIKAEYTKRLLEKIPKYKSIPPELIPDMFLQALRNHERDLVSETGK